MLDELKNILFSNKDICYICKDKVDNTKPFICKDCYENLEILDKVSKIEFEFINKSYYSLSYNRFTREKLSDYKFNEKNYLYKPFGEIMVATARKLEIHKEIDLICYIPSHRRREAIRGYNQAELLAKYISIALDKPLSKNNLIKIKNTKTQSSLDRLGRRLNLKESFSTKDPKEIKGKKILLIDDIITTGVTLEECGRILLRNGATEVTGLTLTSGKI